jgi:hypothetical protein
MSIVVISFRKLLEKVLVVTGLCLLFDADVTAFSNKSLELWAMERVQIQRIPHRLSYQLRLFESVFFHCYRAKGLVAVAVAVGCADCGRTNMRI